MDNMRISGTEPSSNYSKTEENALDKEVEKLQKKKDCLSF